ncbi:MAG TPA: recombinase family protein [Rhizomicrobium sp.]|nr:recombinase family protein [Rhizomicrobium sp.]
MTKRVAVYARVSTTRQAENDISIPDQLAQARKYCNSRNWHVIREFVDPGASARDDKRPEFQRLMDAACVDPSPFDVILVHSISRFFRDVAGYTFWKRKLEKHGVSLVSITQSFGEGTSANFAETVLAAADQYHSEETAKHVTRTMLENARQGFWNGSQAPFGYRTIDAEKRGQKIKKRLEIEEREAGTVRQIFKLFLEGDKTQGPMGVKEISSWLNRNGFRNRSGNPFYTSIVYAALTRSAYSGVYYFNTHDSRTRRARPKTEWVAVQVPPIISEADFNCVQARLRARRPSMTPPRTSNSEVLLTGLARCDSCGSAMMLRTGKGKGGYYRYYACSANRLKGASTCKRPIAVREDELDRLIISALADTLLTPERLATLLGEAIRHRRSTTSQNRTRKTALEKQRKEIDTQIERLITAVAEGTLPDMGPLRARVDELTGNRDECARLLAGLDTEIPELRQTLSRQQAVSVAGALKRKLLDAPRPLQKRYVQGLVSEIVIDGEKATISGPPLALAAAVTAPDKLGEVRSFVREWRARRDSNP